MTHTENIIEQESDQDFLFRKMLSLYHDKHSIARFKTEQKIVIMQQRKDAQDYFKHIKNKDFSKLEIQLSNHFRERMIKFNTDIDKRIMELKEMKFKL